MNRFEKRKLKRNIYKHGNAIMYTAIFVMASIITIAAAANRTDKIAYVDESQMVSTAKESVDMKNSENPKVAATETNTEEITTVQETTTELQETETIEVETFTEAATEAVPQKVKITADSLNVRAQATTDSEPIGSAMMNQEFEVVSQSGEWIEIKFDDKNGFIKAEFAEIIE